MRYFLFVILALGGCAPPLGQVGSPSVANLQTVSAGMLAVGGSERFFAYYVIDRTTRLCYTVLTVNSAVATDCNRLMALPAARRILAPLGFTASPPTPPTPPAAPEAPAPAPQTP